MIVGGLQSPIRLSDPPSRPVQRYFTKPFNNIPRESYRAPVQLYPCINDAIHKTR